MLQAVTHMLYACSPSSATPAGPRTAVFVDYVAGAMGTSAFMAFLMSVCNPTGERDRSSRF